jgi:hypothetical protein
MSHFNFYLVRHFLLGFLAVCAGFTLLGAFHPLGSPRLLRERERFALIRSAAEQADIGSIDIIDTNHSYPMPLLSIIYRRTWTGSIGNEITLACVIRETGMFPNYDYHIGARDFSSENAASTYISAENVARLDCDHPEPRANRGLFQYVPTCVVGITCCGCMGNE